MEHVIRDAYLTALHDRDSKNYSFDNYRLSVERLRAEAAAAVKKARERAGFTPEGLAKRAGLPVKKVEGAERGYIDGEIATKLAVPVEVDAHKLCPLDLWGQPTPKESSEP